MQYFEKYLLKKNIEKFHLNNKELMAKNCNNKKKNCIFFMIKAQLS